MLHTRTFLTAVFIALVYLAPAHGQEPIRFGRTPDISPDGRLVAFSYLGDIWTVETIGGIARPVTMHEAHDVLPVFSPDGRYIAFSSNRHGSYDVFIVPVQGGRPRRLTFDSADEIVNGWSPDGKTILFTSAQSTNFPSAADLYAVPVEGGRVRRITYSDGKDGVYSPKGDHIAYVRGPGTWYRKGYRGSSNDDIWVCNADGSSPHRVTDFIGQDTSPMWAPDGQTLYYVSERFGTPANIVRQSLTSKSPPEKVTEHKEEAVRRARISGNGEWIVYECGADLWVAPTKGGSPRNLAIEVHADDKTNTEKTTTFTQGASEYSLSADERHIAFVVHGQMFMMPIAGGKAVRLCESAANDHAIAWSPDSKKILFASDRGGFEDLYLLEPDDPEHPELVKAHKFKVKQLTHTPEKETGASFSPDGKRIAFIRSGKLWTMNPDGTGEKAIVNDVQVVDYDWSPDSKFLVYAREDGYMASDLYIMPVTGGAAKNVTRFATYNAGVTWSWKGKKLAFISERRRNEPTVYVLSLQKPSAPGAPSSSDIDWEDIHLRAESPAPLPTMECAISADGSKVAFSSFGELWVASTSGGHIMRLTTGTQRPQEIQWSRLSYSPDTIYYRDGSGHLRKASASTPSAGDIFRFSLGGPDATRIPFSAKLTVRRDEQFSEMFEQSWRALAEEFYDPLYHGVDWNEVRKKFRPIVKHVAMREDFYSLVKVMLGELNASHLDIGGYMPPPEETTADLGLIWDEKYTGPGLKVAEVLKRGPADKRGINVKAGDIVLAIDGAELTDRVDISKLLNAKSGEAVTLQVSSNPTDPRAKRRIEIQAVNRDQIQELMYDRWVQSNVDRVSKLSGGKLGYIHIPSMDEAGLDRFVRALYSDNFDKDAIVLDVRYNGGGYTHEQLLSYLGGREHTYFRQRDGGQGLVMRSFDRKWTKPLVLLINNRSYSDAEIFPSAFRTLGLGKLVGQPTGAHVIGTVNVRLIDGSIFRIPRVGVFTTTGTNMERQGVLPDVAVEEGPEQLAQGKDLQLEKAVEVLQQDVVAWKRARTNVALKPVEPKGPVAVPAVTGK
jgi:tricorn protease